MGGLPSLSGSSSSGVSATARFGPVIGGGTVPVWGWLVVGLVFVGAFLWLRRR